MWLGVPLGSKVKLLGVLLPLSFLLSVRLSGHKIEIYRVNSSTQAAPTHPAKNGHEGPPVLQEDFILQVHGNFCVVQNFVPGPGVDTKVTQPVISLATHGSLHYLSDLRELVRAWDGPLVSAALFVENRASIPAAVALIRLATACESLFREKLSVHLFFPVADDGDCGSIKTQPVATVCPANDAYWKRVDEEVQQFRADPKMSGLAYPFNIGRNLAKHSVKTELVMLVDMELIPVSGFYEKIQDFFLRWTQTNGPTLQNEVFVIQTFEINTNWKMKLPTSKEELWLLVRDLKAFPFHAKLGTAAKCHRIPGLKEWWKTGKAAAVDVLHTTAFATPCWEPVYISSTSTPRYNESFAGFGYNKMQQAYELCRAGYKFHSLTQLFLFHKGVKHRGFETAERAKVNMANNELFLQFERAMDEKYGEQTRQGCSGDLWGPPFVT